EPDLSTLINISANVMSARCSSLNVFVSVELELYVTPFRYLSVTRSFTTDSTAFTNARLTKLLVHVLLLSTKIVSNLPVVTTSRSHSWYPYVTLDSLILPSRK